MNPNAPQLLTAIVAVAVLVLLVAVVYGWLGVHTRRVRRLEEQRRYRYHPVSGKKLPVFTAEELPDVVAWYERQTEQR